MSTGIPCQAHPWAEIILVRLVETINLLVDQFGDACRGDLLRGQDGFPIIPTFAEPIAEIGIPAQPVVESQIRSNLPSVLNEKGKFLSEGIECSRSCLPCLGVVIPRFLIGMFV